VKLQFFVADFWKVFRYKISWKSIQWSWIVPCAQSQTDGQTWQI